ncbi:hypothetical protein E4T38_09961, partial [Aureobasidium subglaciale]
EAETAASNLKPVDKAPDALEKDREAKLEFYLLGRIKTLQRSALYTAILANEMGLGKTISIYSTIVAGARYAERNKRSSILNGMEYKPTLIIAPSGALLP